MRRFLLISIILIAGCNQYSGGQSSVRDEATKTPPTAGIVYSNPRVYNVDYSFEMVPDPNNIDRAKDLKVWISIPREWDSQKAVQIISVQPEPHARYVDPEYGNPMLFWDFGKEREQPSYKVDIKFRLESYDVKVEVDPNRVGPYDKTSKEYALYTRSTHTVHITPKIRELAREAVGDETNPYLQAERIVKFVKRKMRFKRLSFERGRGIDCLLAYPVIDEKTGQVYYEGSCNQYSAFMVALCRAVGIPARCVFGYVGWSPWIEPNDAKARFPFETKLSPDGLAATQHYGGLIPHVWSEFFIPNCGWIPADAQRGIFGHQDNQVCVMSKGRDVLLGSGAPPEDGEGYGVQWVALHDGRTDILWNGIVNIAKIRTIKVITLHHSDPFPADGLADNLENLPPSRDAEKDLKPWRQKALRWPSYLVRSSVSEPLNTELFYKDYPQAKGDKEAFVCHMLRRQLDDEKFFELANAYLTLRHRSGRAVPTSRFEELAEGIYGKPLNWFFDQWVNSIDLPRLKLENVTSTKNHEGWQVEGRLLQTGDKTFRLPIEIALDTDNGREERKLRVETKTTDFKFRTSHKPRKLVVDPNYEILKVQEMAPRLWWFWDIYPNLIVVYGTLAETEANKKAAERFNSDYLGLDSKIIKADTDVNDTDLKAMCVFLIGRPETNRVAQQFKDRFPVKFDGAEFTWKGVIYDKPKQGVAQIVRNPNHAQGLMIMYAGLSPEATIKFCDLYLYDADASFVIFDTDKELLSGDWEDMDSNLYWKFDTHQSVQLAPDKQ